MAVTADVKQGEGSIVSLAPREAVRGTSNTQRALRRLMRHRMALVGVALLTFVVLYVLIGSAAIPEASANFNNPANALRAPSAEHPFGTDVIGRDILARTIYGGQVSLFIAITAVLVQILVGTLIGLVPGYFGGAIDSTLMRIAEMLLAIPQIFIAAIVVRVLSDPERLKLMSLSSTFKFAGREFSITLFLLILVIGLTSWMRVSRIVRASVLSIKEQEYITAARSIGVRSRRIVLGHILPNCMGPIIVAATLGVASAILLEAYLGFLGLGVRPPTATWGNMMQEAAAHPKEWFYWFFPAFFIMLTALGINFFGDGLRDALDPRSKN